MCRWSFLDRYADCDPVAGKSNPDDVIFGAGGTTYTVALDMRTGSIPLQSQHRLHLNWPCSCIADLLAG